MYAYLWSLRSFDVIIWLHGCYLSRVSVLLDLGWYWLLLLLQDLVLICLLIWFRGTDGTEL